MSQFEEILSKINTIASKLRKLFGNPKEVVTIDRIFINITTAYSSKISEVLTSEIHGKIPDDVFRKAIEALNALSNMVDKCSTKLGDLIRTKLVNVSSIGYKRGSANLRFDRFIENGGFIILRYERTTISEFRIEVSEKSFELSNGRHSLEVKEDTAHINVNERAGIIEDVYDLFKRIVDTYLRDDIIKLYNSLRTHKCHHLHIKLNVIKDNTEYEIHLIFDGLSLEIRAYSPYGNYKYELFGPKYSIDVEEPLDLKLLNVVKEVVLDVMTKRADDIKSIACINIPRIIFREKVLHVTRDNIKIRFEPSIVTAVDTVTGNELKLEYIPGVWITSKDLDKALDFGKKAIREIFRAGAMITLYP